MLIGCCRCRGFYTVYLATIYIAQKQPVTDCQQTETILLMFRNLLEKQRKDSKATNTAAEYKQLYRYKEFSDFILTRGDIE